MKHLEVRSVVPATTAINANTSGNSFLEATEKPALELKRINMTYRRDTASSMRGFFNLLPAQMPASSANSPVSRTQVAGETRPIAPNDTSQNRALNRCVEIEVNQHAR